MNVILKDIQTHNGCTCPEGAKQADGACCTPPVQNKLVDIMSVVLPALSVPGKHVDEYCQVSLNGNESITLLNNFPAIVGQLLGVKLPANRFYVKFCCC